VIEFVRKKYRRIEILINAGSEIVSMKSKSKNKCIELKYISTNTIKY